MADNHGIQVTAGGSSAPDNPLFKGTLDGGSISFGGQGDVQYQQTPQWDTHSGFDSANQNYVIPQDGVYRINFITQIDSIVLAGGTPGFITIRLRVGPGTAFRKEYGIHTNAARNLDLRIDYEFTAGQTVTIGFQTSGVGFDIGSSAAQTTFEVEFIREV